ncbi:hypothetical protein M8C13_06250 [Crossiella sp. SN42]|uniref:hypothetical protein n=1 Tax=Crossiella sp. SN42 TaxID=2944808 RepID=UPI00207C2C44|nr:hypothetical protein [Crossiella sp. SN42]MCO1575361.1 hypothetical protein [Crossiella sp. SN42]
MPATALPRRFSLSHHRDLTGLPTGGYVADGVLFPDGTVVVHWRGPHPSTVVWKSLADPMALRGNGGATWLHWIDKPAQGERTAG